MDPVQPPEAGRPARTARALVIAVTAAVVTVALGVVTSVLVFGPPGTGTRSVPAPPQTRTLSMAPTTSPPDSAEPSPRVTVVIREPATFTAETVLGAIASTGTLLAGVGTLLAAVAALRTTRAAGPSRQRKRSKNRRR